MICPHCEFEIEDSLEICPYCQMFVKERKTSSGTKEMEVTGEEDVSKGTAIGYDDFYDHPINDSFQEKLTQKEFMKLPELKQYRNYILLGTMIMYLSALCTGVLNIAFLHNPFAFVDVILVLALTISIQITKNKICAVILCAYAAINSLAVTFMRGRLGGFQILIASVFIVIAVFQIQKAWERYEETGTMPEQTPKSMFRL